MKKIILSFLFCLGVGFTMMGSPAQVGDDDNSAKAKGDAAVLTVTTLDEKPVAPVQYGNGLIKHPWKVKKIDVSKLKARKPNDWTDKPIDWNKYRLRDLQVCQNINILVNRVVGRWNELPEKGIPKRQEPPK